MKDTKTDFIVIKALEDGVNVIGLTRGTNTKFHIQKNSIKMRL